MSRPHSIGETVLILGVTFLCCLITVNAIVRQFAASAEKPPLQSVGSTFPSKASPPPAPQDLPLAPDEPNQTDILTPHPFFFKGYQFHELARFSARALLLSKRAYTAASGEHRGVLAPCDFAIAWGPMSTPSVIKNFTFFQKNRFFYYASLMSFAGQAARLHTDWHVANVHLIPANESISAALAKVQPHDIVTLEGTLVEVLYEGQVVWRSSLSRTDTGDGACELLYLTHITWSSHPSGTETIPYPQAPSGE